VVIAFAATCAYPQEFDLSKLPSYKLSRNDPTSHCHNDKCNGEWGVIRIHGIELNQALIGRWQNGFLKLHPNIRFSDYFVPNGFAGLTVGTHDLSVIGHSVWRSDFKAFQGIYGYAPLELMFATGGFNKRTGNTPAPIFIVNQANPISKLSLELDEIFGAERTGGWTPDYVWSTATARSSGKNIRTWGAVRGITKL
jgi:phosphate transport system substrate-binding protein